MLANAEGWMHCTTAGIRRHCFELGVCNKQAAECDSPNVLSKCVFFLSHKTKLITSAQLLSAIIKRFSFSRTTNMMRQNTISFTREASQSNFIADIWKQYSLLKLAAV